MAHSPPAVVIIPERVSGITAILPIGPIMPSNSDFAMTLPFKASKVSQELRAAIIKRTKNRWAWFSRAEDLDEERGTQLGTLGYLPWEIRQKIFEEFFEGNFRARIVRGSGCIRPPLFDSIDPPGAWYWAGYPGVFRLWEIRLASASLKHEVEYAFFTMMNFHFDSIEAMMDFLVNLKTYEKSLLRSVSVLLDVWSDINVARESWMDACAKLPSGLTSIKFELYYCLVRSWRYWFEPDEINPNLVESLELLFTKIKRCWSPRADISLDYGRYTPW